MSLEIPQISATAYFDHNIIIERADPSQQNISRLEQLTADLREGRITEAEVPPMALYVSCLAELKLAPTR
ncbi:MAG TPA: hypothetical protein VMR45_04515 [Patescibacteria group bacterium]|jgi:hypothetical protein|nr:hypothetical protein [Patescibacteria group bacterium]